MSRCSNVDKALTVRYPEYWYMQMSIHMFMRGWLEVDVGPSKGLCGANVRSSWGGCIEDKQIKQVYALSRFVSFIYYSFSLELSGWISIWSILHNKYKHSVPWLFRSLLISLRSRHASSTVPSFWEGIKQPLPHACLGHVTAISSSPLNWQSKGRISVKVASSMLLPTQTYHFILLLG